MSSTTPQTAASRVLEDPIMVENILQNLATADIQSSRVISSVFKEDGRQMRPHWIDSDECQSRLRDLRGSSARNISVDRHGVPTTRSGIFDHNAMAMTMSPDIRPYTLGETLTVFPNMETFYVNCRPDGGDSNKQPEGVIVDRISEQLWIMRSNMAASPARTALLNRLTNGFFSPDAISNCPEVTNHNNFFYRNVHSLDRLHKSKTSRYIRCTNLVPAYRPHDDALGQDGVVYNISAFGRLLRAQTLNATVGADPIDTIEYAPLNADRLYSYQRIAKTPFPPACHGITTVMITSPTNAPDYFELLSDPEFPGQLNNLKHLVLDVSLNEAEHSIRNVSASFSTPHLKTVTLRLQDSRTDDATEDGDLGVVTGALDAEMDEETEEEFLPLSDALARPFLGSTADILFVAAPGCEHLAEVCRTATSAINNDG